MRLINICVNRVGSPKIEAGMFLSILSLNVICFSSDLGANITLRDSNKSRTLNEIFSIVNFPASIFEKSKISLIIFNKLEPLDLTAIKYSDCVLSKLVFSSKSENPKMEFIGVRIS